jgi:hypothetical protein
MSDIWCWPVLKLKMAMRLRQRTTISTPNITLDRCLQIQERPKALIDNIQRPT